MPVINAVTPGAIFPTEEGPCSWTIETSCCPGWDDLPEQTKSVATAYATYLLWALTGRRYGPCSVIVRPCSPKCEGFNGYRTWPVGSPGTTGAGAPWMIPYVDNGTWRNCGCNGGCSCRARCEVRLEGPVAAIDEVRVDGLVLDPSAYRLDHVGTRAVLVRTDGECWPECQDYDLDITEPGTFAVTYQMGVAVPRAGQIAAGLLVCEFAKLCAGGDCALPADIQSLTRNGVEVQIVDPSTLPENILTGVAAVDRWVRAVNPHNLAAPGRVLSPDVRPSRFVS